MTLEFELFAAGLWAQQIGFFASGRARRESGFVLRHFILARLAATGNGVTHLSAIIALNLRPIFRLVTITGVMSGLFAVSAGNSREVTRLITVAGDVVFGSAIAAGARATISNIGAIFGKMASFVALPAFNITRRSGLGAVRSNMLHRSAVTASMLVLPLLSAITHAVSSPITV